MIEPPLPFGNAAARWYYVLLRGLVERGHRVTAIAACSKLEEISTAQALFPAPAYDLHCYPYPRRRGLRDKWQSLRRPYSFMFSTELRCQLSTELARGFDVLHLEQLWSGWLGLEHVDRALVNVHHLVWIDLEKLRPVSWQERLERSLMLATERRLVRSLKHFRSFTPRLVPEMTQVNPEAQITTVPFGMDASLYDYIPNARRTNQPIISLFGTMSWFPSQSAAVRLLARLWPEIKRQVPAARLQIVGWNARAVLHDFLALPDVTIEENVPDMQPYFANTAVFVYAPERGSGMKIKVLEALAFGVPVVTTSEGVEGLPAEDGLHAGVTEDDVGLIERTVRLLKDPIAQNRQRAEGRALLERHCAPRPTLDAIESIYERMLSRDNP